MPSPFSELISCLHRAPCWHCRGTGKCRAPLLGHLLEYSRRLAAWARREPSASEDELSALAREFAAEMRAPGTRCAVRADSAGPAGGRIRPDDPGRPSRTAHPV